MPSRAERRRSWELLLRLAALSLLAAALWRAVMAHRAGAVPAVHVTLSGAERLATRDSLAALARAGTRVTWSGVIAPLAASVEPVREPSGGWRVAIASEGSAEVADEIGPLDSIGIGGGSLVAGGLRGGLEVRAAGTVARPLLGDAPALGRVLVFGRAGWESKFVVAALEEEGWLVDAVLRLSDTTAVRQGSAARLGLATHAVVVVLDAAVLGTGASAGASARATAGATAGAIERFVRDGGGLVLAGEGAGSRAFRAIAPTSVERVDAPRERSFAGTDPFDALPRHRLGARRPDAVVLAGRNGVIDAVARRVGAGRVVQAAFADTWRWRMEGEAGSPAAHRAYWSLLVGAAAPTAFAAPASGSASMPLAATIAALGPALASDPTGAPRGDALPLWLGALVLALLVAEWASRRTRGAA